MQMANCSGQSNLTIKWDFFLLWLNIYVGNAKRKPQHLWIGRKSPTCDTPANRTGEVRVSAEQEVDYSEW